MSKLQELSETIQAITKWANMPKDNTQKAMIKFLRTHRDNIIKRGY